MPTSPRPLSARIRLAFAVAAVAAVPVVAQDRPESILPPGFGDATPAPRATPTPGTSATPSASTAVVQPLPLPLPSDTPSPTPSASPTPIDPSVLAEYEMPESARRSLDEVGPASTREGALSPDAFGTADGQYLEALMRRLDAPLPSRWLSILLRRTLVSRLTTPDRVNGADFAAERAWLLLRMGESVAARAVVQGVDNDNYTPKLYQVAMNAALATGDPGELCPLADAAVAATGERGWTLAQAICAGLSGEAAKASALIKTAKNRRIASGIDLQLAQKVVGAGAQGRQAVTIEWDGVDRLSAWRFGLATATGVVIPDTLYASAGPQVRYWSALAPSVGIADRLSAAEAAAGQGVLSNAALVDLYGAAGSDDNASSAVAATASDLRTAYADRSADARLTALKQIWGAGARVDYARLVLTARAAVRMPPATGRPEADRLVASMLTAGLDRSAAQWLGSVDSGGDAWAMLTLADPDAGGRLSYGQLSSYAGQGNAALKQRLLFAGLAGLGRLSSSDVERAASALDVKIGAENGWTRALDTAARDNQPGTVVLLAAIGMQTPDWRGVPPEALYRIIGALRAVGLDGEARMIAAEAIARA